MKKITLGFIGIAAFLVVSFSLTTQVSAAPNDNPLLATVKRVQTLLEKLQQSMINLRKENALVKDRVENLEVWRDNHVHEPPCATCSAVVREDIVKIVHEETAITSLQSLFFAQGIYFKEDTDKNGTYDYAPVAEHLFQSGRLIDNVLATGEKQGYQFVIGIKPQQIGFEIIARPKNNKTGGRSFFVDETGVIRASSSAGVNTGSPPLEN